MATITTALFDIKKTRVKNHKLALKTFDNYLDVFKITLQLNCPMVIYTEEKVKEFILKYRPKDYKTKIIIQKLENISYYKYYDKIEKILKSNEYKKRIKDNERIECNLPEYTIIQYSKLGWLKETIHSNPFNTKYHLWMDAGCSRFFANSDLLKPFPSPKVINLLNNGKILAQCRDDINRININDNFIWTSYNVISGGLFGGLSTTILELANDVEYIWNEYFLKNNCVNNEQLVFGIIWKLKPHLFQLIMNKSQWGEHLPLFRIMYAT